MDQAERPPVYEQGPARGSGGSVNGWLVAVLIILFAALYLQMSGLWPRPLLDPNAAPRPITARGNLADDEKATIELFSAVSPSVVHVTTSIVGRYRMNPVEIPRGSGSGFIWDANGYIVTNYHVISEARQNGGGKIRVVLSDSNTYSADVVGVSPANDLAVLRINAPANKLKPVPIGTSADLKVGQKVFAIGSPFSLDQSLTTGIVSGLGRELASKEGHTIKDMIQVNAAINPGNSGGPLLDSAGRLIGVNSAILTESGMFSGIGFAIPVDTVNTVVPQLIQSGSQEPPALGLTLFRDEQTDLFRDRGMFKEEGVLVADVWPRGTAAAAGIHPTQVGERQVVLGDLIVSIDGKLTPTVASIPRAIAGKKVGDVVTLEVIRNGRRVTVPVILRPRPEQDE